MGSSEQSRQIPPPPAPPTPPKRRVVYEDDRLARMDRGCDCGWFICVCKLKKAINKLRSRIRSSGGYQPDVTEGSPALPPKKP